jgi:long-chain acyl-CoA synthetase
MNLASIITLHGRYLGDHPAIEAASRVITYRELDQIAARISTGLARSGIGRGDVVGVMLGDTPEHICTVLGIMRRGAVVLPMDWRWKPPEAARAAERFSPRLVVVEDDRETAGDVETVPVSALLSAAPDPSPPVSLDRDAPLFYAITSGTTGDSKAAIITHGQMHARFIYYLTDLAVRKEARFCCAFPLAYAAGRALFMAHLLVGATFVVFPTMFDPQELVSAVRERSITGIGVPPHVSRSLLKLPQTGDDPLLPGLTSYISMTAGLRPEEKLEILKRISPALIENYANMVGGLVTVLSGKDMEEAPDSVGRPAFGVELEIVDDDDNPLPPGAVGHIRHRGPAVAKGFVNPGMAGNEKFQDGWLYPGDLGSFDARGRLRLHGRTSEIIKRGGMTIYAVEVERVLAELDAIAEVAVVGAPSEEFGEEVIAFVVLNAPVDQRTLIAHCRRSLAAYKVPRRIVVRDLLPRNSAGKVVKAQLAQAPAPDG